MKRVALVFVVAVLAPSLVLAWLAVRSLRDQQFLLERQQSLLDQQVTDALAQNISDYLAQQQKTFSAQVESLAAAGDARTLAAQFDDQLRRHWPLAEVGFCVTASGKILSPQPNARPAAQMFRLDNSSFLGNHEPVEVYLTPNNANVGVAGGNALANNSWNNGRGQNGFYANSAAPLPAQPPPQSSVVSSEVASSTSPLQPKLSAASLAGSAGSFGGGGGFGGLSRNELPHAEKEASPPPAGLPPSGSEQTQALAANRGLNAQTALANVTPQAFTLDDRATKNLNSDRQNRSQTPPPAIAYDDVVMKEVPVLPTHPNVQPAVPETGAAVQSDVASQSQYANTFNYKAAQTRKVSPQSQIYQKVDNAKTESATGDGQNNLSKVVPAEAEFRQLVGDQNDGMLARFLQNKLKLMCWHRLRADPDLIFGAQLSLDRVVDGLRGLVQPDRAWGGQICLAVLDDNARPVVSSRPQYQTNWKRPFVATEVGDALPHWEAAAYLIDPAQLTEAAQTARLTLGLLVGVLVIAIGIGSLLIVRSLGAELKLARQKTDFVSNVSHELKTPLTSIRMFSELLAEGRVADSAKQHSYLQIITAEAARLTRLINNVLDFSRMERGEKKYNFQPCDLTDLVRTTAETFRPHLESAGFQFTCELPGAPIAVRGDADALSQVIVNLLSNAEKYSGQSEGGSQPSSNPTIQPSSPPAVPGRDTGAPGKEISLQLAQKPSPLPHAEIRVLDRGPGVPLGCEEKVFEKFYRAHDSLSSGIQGSGLGLTIARQIARAHGGDVVYEAREGGGSCFILRLPIQTH